MTPYCTLTADGRVLTSAEYIAGDDRIPFDDRGGLLYLPPSHPLAWEAPDCQKCGGSGWESCVVDSDGVFVEGRDGCPVCGGTGVDDSIPLTLVGVGSVLQQTHSGGSGWLVNAVLNDGRMVLSGRTDAPYHGNEDCWPLRTVPAADIGHGAPWQVVRAVPPAHTGDTA